MCVNHCTLVNLSQVISYNCHVGYWSAILFIREKLMCAVEHGLNSILSNLWSTKLCVVYLH